MTVEDLLWQILVLQLRVFEETDELVPAHGRDAVAPLIRVLNSIDERVFHALFALVPGMYEESDAEGKAREERARERFGGLPGSLDLSGTPSERLERLLSEIRRRLGTATLQLDVSDNGDDEATALGEPEWALEAVAESNVLLDQLG